MIFEVLIMLCNADILINVTPIFIQAFADSLSLTSFLFQLLCTYCTILTKLCYCHQINMMSGLYSVLMSNEGGHFGYHILKMTAIMNQISVNWILKA